MSEPIVATRLEWMSKLDIGNRPSANRRTSIICTIGPNTNSIKMMCDLRSAGMNIVRLNFSHGSYEYHGSVIQNARDSFKEMPGRPMAIALDTKGPEIRTGNMKDDKEVLFKANQEITVTNDPAFKDASTSETLYIDYPSLARSLQPGKVIFIDDGSLTLQVVKIVDDHNIRARPVNNHKLTNRKNVNLPGTDVDLPAVSVKDKADLEFAVKQGLDMIFASFIRRADNVHEIRKVLGEEGKNILIVSKIENLQGVANFDEILAVSDGIMVARGDLGMEIPLEKVFVAQKMMISKCNMAGKPVICATQMLESMTNNPRPTRAEVSDVANAVLDGADCVMLSGETAKGIYPIEATQMMNKICIEAESAICYPPLFLEVRAMAKRPFGNTETVASSAVNATQEQDIGAIFVLTTSGSSARLLSKYRPHVPIIVVTRSEQVARQIHLYRGCYPFVYAEPKTFDVSKEVWQDDVDTRIRWAMGHAMDMGLIVKGCHILAIQGWRGGSGRTNTMRILDSQTLL